MGSYDNIVKIEEMRKKMEENDPFSAMQILDTMELRKIKNLSDLSLLAEVYTKNERYEEAKELLLKIYQKSKTRKVLYQLVWVFIQNNNIEEAEKYLTEFEKVAPQDFYRYIFRYKIDRLKGETFEKQIESLEALKRSEYIEQWAYELAKLYYKAGMEKECIRECSDIILWFGEGTFVEKAKMLRSYYSGETDKDKMIEELKRRSQVEITVSNPEEEAEPSDSGQTTDYIEDDLAAQGDLIDTEDDFPSDEDDSADADIEDISSNLMKTMGDIWNDDAKEEIENQEPEGYPDTKESQIEDSRYDEPQREESGFETPGSLQEETLPREDKLSNTDKPQDMYDEETPRTEYTTGPEQEEYVEDRADLNFNKQEEADEDDLRLQELSNDLNMDLAEIFKNFLHVKSVKKQLVKSIELILNDRAKTIQLMITGTTGSGKTTLAKDISIFLYKFGRLRSSKVAKISAEKLNTVDLMKKKETLKDCCMIVENASELKRSTIDQILELIKYFHGDIVVIFEENKKNMNKLFRECPKLMDLFKNRIHLPQYNEEELLGFAYACINQQEYELHPSAYAVLSDRINQIGKQKDTEKQLEMIQQLVKDAMDAADVRMGKQLSNLAVEGRLMDVQTLSILPEDFRL